MNSSFAFSLVQEKQARLEEYRKNCVQTVMGPTGTVITFPESMGLPSIFNSKPVRLYTMLLILNTYLSAFNHFNCSICRLITFCRLSVTYMIYFISSAIHLQGRSVQARIAQTPTSTGTPRQGFHCAAWHATRLSRDVLSRGVKLHKEVLLPREVSLTREVMRPREVADQ